MLLDFQQEGAKSNRMDLQSCTAPQSSEMIRGEVAIPAVKGWGRLSVNDIAVPVKTLSNC